MKQNGRSIYIVGSSEMNNRFMADHIEAHFETTCFTENNLCRIPRSEGRIDSEEKNLVLYDCLDRRREDLLEMLRGEAKEISNPSFLAMFNLADDLDIESHALNHGVRGFFYRNDVPDTLLRGIGAILKGEIWVSRNKLVDCLFKGEAYRFAEFKTSAGLTLREAQILDLLGKGATNPTIADALCISPHTVKTHVYNLYRKINVNNRLQAAQWAVKNV